MKNNPYGSWPPRLRRLAMQAHVSLTAFCPQFEVKPAWGGVGYKLGRNYSVVVARYDDHIKLMLWRGKDLKDPRGILAGSGSNTRHLRVAEVADLRPAVLRDLLAQQHRLFASGTKSERAPRPRPAVPMPEDVRTELSARGLLDAYEARPAYQRRDYSSWINAAKRDETRKRRLEQMLMELEAGDVYMKMAWKGASG